MYYYSSKFNGFFSKYVNGDLMPPDAILIPKEYYIQLLDGQSSGFSIKPDENGYPYLDKLDYSPSMVLEVTRAQGKSALIRAGLWQGVVDFVNSISNPVEKAVAEVALNDTTHWQRSSPFLNSAAEALGLTDEQLDQLFIDASKIEL